MRADSIAGTVEATTSIHAPQVMYNLTVGAAHTFFVGHGDWLVHNDDPFSKLVEGALTLVELGAGDYQNAIQFKLQNPLVNVIATNDAVEWDLGRRLHIKGLAPNDTSQFLHDMFKGYRMADNLGIVVGESQTGVLTNADPRLRNIADIVHTIMPYPKTAYEFGVTAATTSNLKPGSIIAITVGSHSGGTTMRQFERGVSTVLKNKIPRFTNMNSTLFGSGRDWEGSQMQETWACTIW